MSIMHKKLMQVVLVKGIDIQDIVTLKKYDKKVKKFLTNKIGDDILIKLSARTTHNKSFQSLVNTRL